MRIPAVIAHINCAIEIIRFLTASWRAFPTETSNTCNKEIPFCSKGKNAAKNK